MDSRAEAVFEAALVPIQRGDPAPTATGTEAGDSSSREITVGILVELIAVRWRED